MGQKLVRSVAYRCYPDWNSRWYAEKDYQQLLHEDLKVRILLKELEGAGISKLKSGGRQAIWVTIHTAGDGYGKGGTGVDKLRRDLEKVTEKVHINIVEIKVPELDGYPSPKALPSSLPEDAFRRP